MSIAEKGIVIVIRKTDTRVYIKEDIFIIEDLENLINGTDIVFVVEHIDYTIVGICLCDTAICTVKEEGCHIPSAKYAVEIFFRHGAVSVNIIGNIGGDGTDSVQRPFSFPYKGVGILSGVILCEILIEHDAGGRVFVG